MIRDLTPGESHELLNRQLYGHLLYRINISEITGRQEEYECW